MTETKRKREWVAEAYVMYDGPYGEQGDVVARTTQQHGSDAYRRWERKIDRDYPGGFVGIRLADND